ncbi:TetR/AcrR family transcriptional regulator [Prauserella cavernicola]|uniref:TetR/AcrR family transcriptional regulator n=1 Tax=Prauserella cavernicola TaxID=2800127 RepID=A0A934V7B0_9PSEU|nr:TetR/AcrR family transcriptional regulator [Prauserella cavernicola]MBK1787509.1 TetR/AcrR family transcriptional regulator [Prauserella cavernicola]
MTDSGGAREESSVAGTSRRDAVLESALGVFARYGYRRTSMEEVARTARISRPGLYFLFESKESLFRAAVTQALERDLAAAERLLADQGTPLRERVLGAFDRWAGRYVGPLSNDVSGVIEQNPDLLGAIVVTAPDRFEALVTKAVEDGPFPETATSVVRTLISVSVGLKHQVETRQEYRDRLAVAIDLLVG